MKRKALAAIMAAAMALSMVGCGGSTSESTDSTKTTEKTEATDSAASADGTVENIDRLARAFYPAILACWNSEEGQREFAAWQAEQAHHTTNEKQEVPVGELPAVHIAIVCGFWQGASYSGAHPVFCFVRSLSFFLTFEIG